MVRIHLVARLFVAAAIGAVAGWANPTIGADFRVDNTVFTQDQKEPSSTSTTIFCGGTVYDYMKAPAETVVFDKTAARFVLLSVPHRTRAELTPTQLAAFVDQMHTLAAKNKDPVVRFLAEPKFEERVDDATGKVTLTSPWVTYRLVLSPQSDPEVVAQYHEFCDYYARLNALLIPGSRPPFGRLVVNAAMARQQATASEVLLSVTPAKGAKQPPTTARSEHRLAQPLEPDDLEQVARTRQHMGSFKLVSFDQYQKLKLR